MCLVAIVGRDVRTTIKGSPAAALLPDLSFAPFRTIVLREN